MNTFVRIAAVALAVAVAAPATAQSKQRHSDTQVQPQAQQAQPQTVVAQAEPYRPPRHDPPPSEPAKVSFGLGAGITASNVAGGPNFGTLLFIPVQLGLGKFAVRVEPYIGWARYDIDLSTQQTGAQFDPKLPGKGSDFNLGIGGFFVYPPVSQMNLYVGGRLGSQWQSYKAADLKRDRRNTILALAGGAEYLPIPRVAFGAELQIGYISFGDTTYHNPGQPAFDAHGGSGTATQATLFARFFLFP